MGRPRAAYQGNLPVNGKVTLAAGTATVAMPRIVAGNIVLLTVQTPGGTPGTLTPVITAGTGFAINSSSNTDTSVVGYSVVEP